MDFNSLGENSPVYVVRKRPFGFLTGTLKAKVSLVRTYAKEKITDSEQQITECSEPLTADEQKTLYSNKLLIEPNIFDEVYDDYEDWGRHGSARDKFQLVGSYEQDGKMIDVLEYIETRTTEREKVNEQLALGGHVYLDQRLDELHYWFFCFHINIYTYPSSALL